MNKFGKQAARFDSRSLKLRDYLLSTYVAPPYVSYTYGIQNWGMMINGPDPMEPSIPQGLEDCTIAACGHAVQVWTQGKITPSDSVILNAYEQWCGYVLGNQKTDNGGVPLTVLNDWRTNTLGGHVLKAFVQPQPQNWAHVMASIAIFGGIYIGLQLPNSAMTQNQNGQIWDVVANDGGLAGGHAVFCPAYHTLDPTANRETTITAITWGGLQKMTLAFWDKYCDESHVLWGAAWQPTGVNLAQLSTDLPTLSN